MFRSIFNHKINVERVTVTLCLIKMISVVRATQMQHREHSKHNEYTFGWIYIQEIYLITCLLI